MAQRATKAAAQAKDRTATNNANEPVARTMETSQQTRTFLVQRPAWLNPEDKTTLVCFTRAIETKAGGQVVHIAKVAGEPQKLRVTIRAGLA